MPDLATKTAPLGYELHYLDSQQFAAKVAHDYARYGKVIKDAGITPD
jgi:tripartite-type tricarboxylate transporter receptor subunit TctC